MTLVEREESSVKCRLKTSLARLLNALLYFMSADNDGISQALESARLAFNMQATPPPPPPQIEKGEEPRGGGEEEEGESVVKDKTIGREKTPQTDVWRWQEDK